MTDTTLTIFNAVANVSFFLGCFYIFRGIALLIGSYKIPDENDREKVVKNAKEILIGGIITTMLAMLLSQLTVQTGQPEPGISNNSVSQNRSTYTVYLDGKSVSYNEVDTDKYEVIVDDDAKIIFLKSY